MSSSTTLSGPEFNALFANLRELDQYLLAEGANKHDRVHLLINTCIVGGVNTGTAIVGTLVKLGFNNRHVGKLLKDNIQPNPVWPNWGRRADGTYHVPPEHLTDG